MADSINTEPDLTITALPYFFFYWNLTAMTSHWPQIQFKLSRSFAYGMPGGSRVLQINRIRSFSVECFIIQQIWNRWKSMFRAGLRVGGATFWLVHVPLCHPPGWRIVNLVMIVLFCSGQKRYTKSSCLRADRGPDAAHGTSLNWRQKTHTEKKRKLGAGQEEVIRVLSDQFNETNQKGLRLEDEPMEGVEGVSTGENG